MTRSVRRLLVTAEYLFAVAGVLALGYCATVFINVRSFQNNAAADFARDIQPRVNRKKIVVPEGAVVAQLSIPRLGVSRVVVEGDDAADLQLGPGHIPGTALPGEHGNVGIAGHRDTFFRPLRLIRKGDVIALATRNGTYRYRVIFTGIVTPDDVQVLDQTKSDVLTLVTCYPFYFVGAAPKRFIVRADRAMPARGQPVNQYRRWPQFALRSARNAV